MREPKEGQRITISVRVTPRLKGLLDEAASANGRSLSQEAERLLELAFDPNNRPASGQDIQMVIAGMARMAGVMMKTGDYLATKGETDDIKASSALKWHAHAILESLPKDAQPVAKEAAQRLRLEGRKAAGK